MRLLIDLAGWTLDLTLTRTITDSSETEHDHVAGSFDVAPPPDGEYVYPEDQVGFRGVSATTGRDPA